VVYIWAMQSSVLDNLLKQNITGLPVKDFLQQITLQYPYFSPAHFFLLQQLKETDADYNGQAAKTALLFNNPHWLYFQLQQTTAVKQTPVIAMFDNNTAINVESNVPQLKMEEAKPAEFTNNQPAEKEVILENNEAAVAPFAETAAEELNSDNDDDTSVLVNENTSLPAEEIPEINLAASIKKAENENAPAFEPMHMVDYFASQGIKLSDEALATDKLGKQLKSFTEWLKTMKKIHTNTTTTSEGTDVAVQAMAEKSNIENEVITEAMAGVFARQGKTAKAIELYEKLSLLNPPKSAYFAAQIKKLKGE
jgi:hypothetical protein